MGVEYVGQNWDWMTSVYGLSTMLFNTATREAFVSRGPSRSGRWKRFDFDGATTG